MIFLVVLILILMGIVFLTWRLRFSLVVQVQGESADINISWRILFCSISVWHRSYQIIDELERFIQKEKDAEFDVTPSKTVKKQKMTNILRERFNMHDFMRRLPCFFKVKVLSISYSLDNPAVLGMISGYADVFLCNFAEFYDMNKGKMKRLVQQVNVKPSFVSLDNSFLADAQIQVKPYKAVFQLMRMVVCLKKHDRGN